MRYEVDRPLEDGRAATVLKADGLLSPAVGSLVFIDRFAFDRVCVGVPVSDTGLGGMKFRWLRPESIDLTEERA